jgi:hypothetical protein
MPRRLGSLSHLLIEPIKSETSLSAGRTPEVLAAAEADGITPLIYMLSVMRNPAADDKRRDAMAMAAASYCTRS